MPRDLISAANNASREISGAIQLHRCGRLHDDELHCMLLYAAKNLINHLNAIDTEGIQE